MLTPNIPQPVQDRIKRFVEVFLANMGDTPTADVPPDMVAGLPSSESWEFWKPVDSPVKEADIAAIEQRIGAKLPPLFAAYLMYKCILMTEFSDVRLPPVPSNRPLLGLEQGIELIVHDPFYRDRRYFAFGYDANDTGPVCFNLNCPSSDGDYPVVQVDYSRLRSPDYIAPTRWQSFAALLDDVEESLVE